MDTLENIRNDVAKFAGSSGLCADDPRTLARINDVRRILTDLGDWRPFVDPLCIYPHECAITLPTRYRYAKNAFLCTQRLTVEHNWFTQVGNWDDWAGRCIGNLVEIPGTFCTFRQWPGCMPGQVKCCIPDGFYPLVMLENGGDKGIEMTFRGPGVARDILSVTRTIDDGPWHDNGPKAGESRFLELTHIIKPKTKGRVRIYGWDGANRILLSWLDADDTLPQFTRYRVPGRGRSPVMVRAKKRYIALSGDPNEIVEISADVIIHGLQALADRESRNLAGYANNIKAAIDLLNKQDAGPESTSTAPIRMSRAYKVTGLIES